ncbi:LuxR C-terminal-related transcriptional regulator [Chromobacterium sp. Beijing]|uniref:helix-turn-helix transcriptional regulator n=1 Tax=Chromobacterium sp. Beijing TaxID=2735795 RepID=UPI001F32414E|nr:LuxR C-terminal-related transcriptional regulator [Chromobacterium sp. Beijing]UJB30921.1 helix-turn-helix transcriptional regulator [Chromobacterium sp. Beijing]
MEALLKELPLHHHLAQLMAHIGLPGFWRQLVLLLRGSVPLDNALAACFHANAPPQILEECDFQHLAAPSPMALYCQGLYLLDPFYQYAQRPFPDGLHHLPDIAPDHFRQSEYFQRYMSGEVGVDEVQLLLRLAPDQVLTLSLGKASAFEPADIGKLRVMQPWLLSAMRRHWQLSSAPTPPSQRLADQLTQTLNHFGHGRLSEREAEVARLTLCGLSSKAIAQQLAISPETVKVHRRNLYLKLGVASHAELFNCYIEQLRGSEA